MVIEFSVSNYRSVDDLQTLSFRAAGLRSEDPKVDEKNLICASERNTLLRIVGIYGANASGKSNIIRSLVLFQEMVASSLFQEDIAELSYEPFRLRTGSTERDAVFQVVLLLEEKKYRYGFSLDYGGRLHKEWLFGPAEKNDTYYFQRTIEKIDINEERFAEGKGLPLDKLRDDALFLGFCASFDGAVSKLIRDFIISQMSFDMGRFESGSPRVRSMHRRRTDNLVISGKKSVVLNWLQEAGIPYSDIVIRLTETERRSPTTYVDLVKQVRNDEGEIVDMAIMDLDRDESEGTRKFYRLIGRIHELFEHGGLFISDEIDGNFHPFLLLKLVQLFQNPKVNKAGAQFLFTSHDTNVMSPTIMRRDQFYFTEKTLKDNTRLYSMADLKGIRNNADFARQYLAGFYGALPQLGNYLEEQAALEQDQ